MHVIIAMGFSKKTGEKASLVLKILNNQFYSYEKLALLGKMRFNTLLFWNWIVCKYQCFNQKSKVTSRNPSSFGTITDIRPMLQAHYLNFL